MGKLGALSLAVGAVAIFALLPAREAAAQDFGQSWIDRITHEYEQDRGPLSPKAFNWTADAGVEYAYDSNIFLTQTNKTSDSIIIPFVQAGLSYAEPRFEVEGSLLGDYKAYAKQTDEDDDEERVFLHARQVSSRWNFEITELFQHVSDPSGVVFLNRVSRVVSTTVPKIAVDLSRTWTFEFNGNFQLVRFRGEPYSSGQDNNNFSIDASGVYHTPWGFELVGTGGYYDINYLTNRFSANGTPGVFGYYGKVGFRGNIIERLTLEGSVGYSTVETDFFVQTNNNIRGGTTVLNANFRYEATETVNFYLDGSRFYAFEGFGDPYQIVNTIAFLAEVDITEELKFRGRLQFDYSDTALHVTRDYVNANAGLTWKFSAHWIADADAGYRWGKTENVGAVKFNDFLFSVGIAFHW